MSMALKIALAPAPVFGVVVAYSVCAEATFALSNRNEERVKVLTMLESSFIRAGESDAARTRDV